MFNRDSCRYLLSCLWNISSLALQAIFPPPDISAARWFLENSFTLFLTSQIYLQKWPDRSLQLILCNVPFIEAEEWEWGVCFFVLFVVVCFLLFVFEVSFQLKSCIPPSVSLNSFAHFPHVLCMAPQIPLQAEQIPLLLW